MVSGADNSRGNGAAEEAPPVNPRMVRMRERREEVEKTSAVIQFDREKLLLDATDEVMGDSKMSPAEKMVMIDLLEDMVRKKGTARQNARQELLRVLGMIQSPRKGRASSSGTGPLILEGGGD